MCCVSTALYDSHLLCTNSELIPRPVAQSLHCGGSEKGERKDANVTERQESKRGGGSRVIINVILDKSLIKTAKVLAHMR